MPAGTAFAVAHRGLSAEQPENSLPAFGAAVAAGFPALELDLHATRDGECVILHDPDLSRTHGDPRRVHELALRDLVALPAHPGVPRLAELFAMLRSWDGLYNLELKVAAAAGPAADAVARHGLDVRVQFSSMDPTCLDAARRLAPEVPRGFIPFGPVEDDDREAAHAAECSWINVDHDFLDSAADVDALHDDGFKVGAWTVNDAGRAKELAGFGVDCVITDVADVHRALGGRAAWA